MIHALTIRKVQNKELWRLLMPSLLHGFNSRSYTLRDLANLTYDLYVIKLQSPKLYFIIVDYFVKQKYDEKDLIYLGARVAVNFLHSITYCNGQEKNEAFFKVVRRFVINNIDTFNRFQLIKLLDIYKYNVHFSNLNLKILMENKLE